MITKILIGSVSGIFWGQMGRLHHWSTIVILAVGIPATVLVLGLYDMLVSWENKDV